MDFTAYQRQAKRTAIYSRRMTFAYLIPAVADEALEVTDTPRGSDDEWDEMGDLLWVSVMLRAVLALPLVIEPYTGGCRRVEHLEAPARWLIHRWTKIARDRNGKPDAADRVFLDEVTTKVLRLVIALAEKRGATIDQLCADNLAKLAGRAERGTLAGSGVR